MKKNAEIENKIPEKTEHLDKKRRKLAKAAIAAPILGSLASRPALGQGRICSVSVLMSGDASIPIDFDSCGGCSPGFWFTAALNNHSCHLPPDINGSTTFGEKFNLLVVNTDPESEVERILNALIEYPFLGFNAANKNTFKNQFSASKQTAAGLFMFARACAGAWLNAMTLGVTFPVLITSGALHSKEDIEGMVDSVFNGNIAGAGSFQSELQLDWDNSEEETCSMFGACN